ncbi:MarR family winged helix-turn-helix transcriptional regulator [Planktotalea frisia]|nr:MarR family transcriptional regulator [Planktotalea frisia]
MNLLSKSTKFTLNDLPRLTMTTELNPLGNHLSYALAAAHRAVTQLLTVRLKKQGIQIEAWRIMECLDAGTKLSMGELAKQALLNPPALSKLVDRMVSNGLVHRQIATADQRQINLLLTNLGRRRMLQVRQDVEEEDRALAEQFDTKDGALLMQLLSQIS